MLSLQRNIVKLGFDKDSSLLIIAFYPKGQKGTSKPIQRIIVDGNTRLRAVNCTELMHIKELPCRVIMLEEGNIHYPLSLSPSPPIPYLLYLCLLLPSSTPFPSPLLPPPPSLSSLLTFSLSLSSPFSTLLLFYLAFLPSFFIMHALGEELSWDISMILGRTRNYMHDTGARQTSIIDDLVFLHNLIDKEKKMTPKQKKETVGYRGPYIEGNSVKWANLAKVMVSFI
jgi:hypothetical protein